jgi:hypothetical protein
MTAPDPGVYISPAQTYQEVRALTEAVARIESKVDGFLRETKDIRRDVDDQEKRIRTLELGETERQKRESGRIDGLEKGRWPLPSVAAVTACTALGLTLYEITGR